VSCHSSGRAGLFRLQRNTVRKIKEGAIEATLLLSALFSVFITISIVVILSYESFGFFREVL